MLFFLHGRHTPQRLQATLCRQTELNSSTMGAYVVGHTDSDPDSDTDLDVDNPISNPPFTTGAVVGRAYDDPYHTEIQDDSVD